MRNLDSREMKNIAIFSLFIIISIFPMYNVSFVCKSEIRHTTEFSNNLGIGDLNLPDKVYSFEAPSDTLFFENLYLNKYYTYEIYLELVTPANCTAKISIWDPDNKKYDIFESEMSSKSESLKWFSIPFGTALEGNYDILFEIKSNLNLNIYISIKETVKCLEDKVASRYMNNPILYTVTRFYNSKRAAIHINLDSDIMYKFFIGRVSPITIIQNSEVRIDYSITSPEGIKYIIYSDYTLPDIDDICVFNFGTSCSGTYDINITIYCNVPYVNIAFLISEDYTISDVNDVNNTKKPDNDENENLFGNFLKNATSISAELIFPSLIIISGIIGIILIPFYINKKKRNLALF
ncbi:MAG: hypothetical protein ACTSQP_05305 [Promethearchaeota archaeon]